MKKEKTYRPVASQHISAGELLGRSMLLSLLVAISATSVARGSVVSSQGTAVPRLVINILVDQLRTDYLEAFMPLYGEEG